MLKIKDMTDIKVANRIKEKILEKNTFEEIEEMSGINIATLKRITSGKRDVKLEEIKKIASVTGANPIKLAFGDVSEKLYDLYFADEVGDEYESRYKALIDLNNKIQNLNSRQLENLCENVNALSILNYNRNINKNNFGFGNNSHGEAVEPYPIKN